MKLLIGSAIAAVAAGQALPYVTTTALPYTSTAVIGVSTLPYSSISAGRVIAAPPQPPRWQQPGIQVARLPPLPPQYDFPLEQTTIDTRTGRLTRPQGAPLPRIPNLIKWRDGNWYQSPTNVWQYVDSPIHQYRDANSPLLGKSPSDFAYLDGDNLVDLSNGAVFNNPYTPPPNLPVAFDGNTAFVLPQDPFQFQASPFQPYNRESQAVPQAPPDAWAGAVGFKEGYNPNTIDILKNIQRLNLSTDYDLNVYAPIPENPPIDVYNSFGWG